MDDVEHVDGVDDVDYVDGVDGCRYVDGVDDVESLWMVFRMSNNMLLVY